MNDYIAHTLAAQQDERLRARARHRHHDPEPRRARRFSFRRPRRAPQPPTVLPVSETAEAARPQPEKEAA